MTIAHRANNTKGLNMKKAIPDEDREKVIALIESGKRDTDLMQIYKCCLATVIMYRVKVCGIKRKKGYNRKPGDLAGRKADIAAQHQVWLKARKRGAPLRDEDRSEE